MMMMMIRIECDVVNGVKRQMSSLYSITEHHQLLLLFSYGRWDSECFQMENCWYKRSIVGAAIIQFSTDWISIIIDIRRIVPRVN